MKVYRSKSKENKKKMSKKTLVSIISAASAAVVALVLTLSFTLGKAPDQPVNVPPASVSEKPTFVMPVKEVTLGMQFSNEKLVKYKTSGNWETHEGVDFLGDKGTTVMAVSDGTVKSIDKNTTMEGTVITIEHADGVTSVYKSLDAEVSVKEGDKVKAGDAIGKIGGTMSVENKEYDKPHLHLEMLKNGEKVNPIDYLSETGEK